MSGLFNFTTDYDQYRPHKILKIVYCKEIVVISQVAKEPEECDKPADME